MILYGNDEFAQELINKKKNSRTCRYKIFEWGNHDFRYKVIFFFLFLNQYKAHLQKFYIELVDTKFPNSQILKIAWRYKITLPMYSDTKIILGKLWTQNLDNRICRHNISPKSHQAVAWTLISPTQFYQNNLFFLGKTVARSCCCRRTTSEKELTEDKFVWLFQWEWEQDCWPTRITEGHLRNYTSQGLGWSLNPDS